MVWMINYIASVRPSVVYQSPIAEYRQSIKAQIDQEFISGQKLFDENNCRTCHRVTGNHADLFISSVKNEYWSSVGKVADFLRNPESFSTEPYIQGRWKKYGVKWPHASYPQITDEEARLIYQYIILAESESYQ